MSILAKCPEDKAMGPQPESTIHFSARRFSISALLKAVAAVASALLLASAFPPMEAAEAAWLAMVPLLLVAAYSGPREAFKWGFASGLAFWLISISWLLCIARTGGPPVLIFAGWVLLCCYCALYMGAFLMVAASLWRSGTVLGNLGLVLGLPLLWVGFEYLRSTLFTGFPWNVIGVSQFRNLAVIQIAEWGGVYAVSAVIMTMNAAVAMTIARLAQAYGKAEPRRTGRLHVELMIGLLVCALSWVHGVRTVKRLRKPQKERTTVKAAAIQPNISQLKKWPPGFASKIYEQLSRLTELAQMGRPDLIVWPETALPGMLDRDAEARTFVENLAVGGVPLLVGAMEVEQRKRTHFYNSAVLIGTDGKIVERYRKRHLVPFGEYIPFDKMLPFIEGLAPLGFSCTAGIVSTVFSLDNPVAAFSVLICFEDTVASLARDSVMNGAGFLINQTNDAWFDGSCAALQHLSHCVFRCVENRVGAVRVANTGITCFIDNTGMIAGVDALEREKWGMYVPRFEISSVEVAGAGAPLTFYTRHGDLPFALPCGIAAAAALIFVILENRKSLR